MMKININLKILLESIALFFISGLLLGLTIWLVGLNMPLQIDSLIGAMKSSFFILATLISGLTSAATMIFGALRIAELIESFFGK